MIDTNRILFIPSTRKGNGTGHLKRCLDWGSDLQVQHLYSLDHSESEIQALKDHPLCSRHPRIRWHSKPTSDWDLIILDNRSTASLPEEFAGIPVIAIDESGSMRDTASYTLDILPSLTQSSPNFRNFNFLKTSHNKRSFSGQTKKILVTFGGEDPSSLGLKVLRALDSDLKKAYDWTFIIPNHQFSEESEKGVECLNYINDLKEQLWNYDLVITSFGLTAFESRASRVPVILINPGSYHDRLSTESEFSFLKNGHKKKSRQVIRFILEQLHTLNQKSLHRIKNGTAEEEKEESCTEESLMDWVGTMSVSRDVCPVCGSCKRKSIGRYPQKSYFLCTDCRMKYMIQFRQKSEIYSKEYFFDEYKAQYGKTYLEDFPHIQKMAEERLKRIDKKDGRILDVGCAYGPFLLKAQEKGFEPWGLEISQDAVTYVKEHFPGLSVHKGAFENLPSGLFEELFFDVLTFWYVIEHFEDLSSVLLKASSLLKRGGVLALSTPHASGVSGLFNKKGFFLQSPEDHFTLWDRRSAKRALTLYGFRNISFHITGHHPERFPKWIRRLTPLGILMQISRIMGWGDTFEIYAVKG